MKWFNHKSLLVVIVEQGDYYGAESTYLHSKPTPIIRVFDHSKLNEGSHSYPLVSHLSLNDYKNSLNRGVGISLANGENINVRDSMAIYDTVASLLINSGALERTAA